MWLVGTAHPTGVARATLHGGAVADLRYGEINDEVLGAMQKPGAYFYLAIAFLGAVIGWGALCWVYQAQFGMGVTGLNNPIGWAVYITNFVFWVGIAHSGTLISAILFLLRAEWRDAVSRSAEAMTIFAIMTAGLFPLIHLGRLWAAVTATYVVSGLVYLVVYRVAPWMKGALQGGSGK